MSDDAMTKPVTRGELIEILSDYATKKDLDTWGGALSDRMTRVEQRLDGVEHGLATVVQTIRETQQTMRETQQTMRENQQTLLDELRRHPAASAEDLRTHVSVVDEQYRDLPARVTRLEATVFAPKKRRATRRAARGRRP